ncbi:MAG: hypothetical protein OQK13_00385 [Gammaproteobacteria bacterium]|nr:hypothetical protein [Gammaproteobacteria bacterium]
MNVFYLSSDPVLSARYHCDKHVVKMILEYAQLMCTAHHLTGSGHAGMYRVTHQNHPSAVWVRKSVSHYMYVFRMWEQLLDEFSIRYGKQHKTGTLYDDLSAAPSLPMTEFQAPPQCMPEEYKRDDAVTAYRVYYKHGKADILQYKHNRPSWLGE